MPEGMANFQCMVLRYLADQLLRESGLRHEYPPFEFATTPSDPGAYPTRVNFTPDLEGRNRLTVGLRIIWAIPAILIAYIIGIVAFVCWFIGAFAGAVHGSWPEGLRSWVEKGLHAVPARVLLYVPAHRPIPAAELRLTARHAATRAVTTTWPSWWIHAPTEQPFSTISTMR